MEPYFFFSYARADESPYIRRLFGDLEVRIRNLAGATTPIGFRDQEAIDLGTRWSKEIAESLRTCRTFVPLYSPTYFTRPYCGKEWAVFRARLRESVRTGRLPPLILPILWHRLDLADFSIPRVATEIQYHHQDFGDEYAARGLSYIMRLRNHRDDYQHFLQSFAETLLRALHDHHIPPASVISDLPQTPSAFHLEDETCLLDRVASRGPGSVRYFLLVGTATELTTVRRDVEAYGSEGTAWQPCHPRHDHPIGPLLQSVAAEELLISDFITNVTDLRATLQEAKKDRNIVILVADNWSLLIGRYKNFAQEFDSFAHYNCLAVVPWNIHDSELHERKSELLRELENAFDNHTTRMPLDQLRIKITRPDELRDAVRSKIVETRRLIIKKTENLRITGTGPALRPQISL